MKDFFTELLQYSHHYNQKLTNVLVLHGQAIPEKSISLFSHILNAHCIWNNRVLPLDTPPGISHIHPTENLLQVEGANHEHSMLILQRFEMDTPVSYTNLKGQSFTNTVRDILFHIVNHSTYHRAQIATDFKQNNIDPLITDYIFYKWQM